MIIYVKSNIFTSPAKVLVNTVNTVGVMGKGLALEFKKLFPDMYKDYRKRCKVYNSFHVGQLLLYKTPTKWVLNFPTKRSWRQNSKLSDIGLGLKKFVDCYKELGITSVAFPELGVGNGNLDWEREVKPLIEKYLSKLHIYIYIHLYDENQYLTLNELNKCVKAPLIQFNYSDVIKKLNRSIQASHNNKISCSKRISQNPMSWAFRIKSGNSYYYLTRQDIEESLNILKTSGALLPFNYPSIITYHNDYSMFNKLLANLHHVKIQVVEFHGKKHYILQLVSI